MTNFSFSFCGIYKKKYPSPLTKPASQFGFGIFLVLMIARLKALKLGNYFFRIVGNPKFIETLILIIFFSPSSVKWSLLFINSTICLNKIK